MLTCERCNSILVKKQTRWCSKYCSKLGLKSAWRKRTIEHQREYQREYRRAKNGGDVAVVRPSELRGERCLRCGGSYDLQLAHVKPLWAGGKHKWVITLCRKCHHKFDDILRDFWKTAIL